MEPSEVIRRFEEAMRHLPIKKPMFIIYQQVCPYSLGMNPRELGLIRKLTLIEKVGKINLGDHL